MSLLVKTDDSLEAAENQRLFDKIIDVTLFDGVEGLDFWAQEDKLPLRQLRNKENKFSCN